jgi:DNA modification methylase
MPIKWKNEKRKLSQLKPADYNPRRLTEDQEKQLTDSIDRFNLADPIVINKNDVVIGGHQRLKILKKRGVKEVDVRVPDVELTTDQEKELNLRLNKNLGEWDFDLLADFDKDMLDDVGFDSSDLDQIFAVELEPNEKDDVVQEVTEPICKPGDLWELGRHRLLCGDSTKVDDVERLMDGKKADMVFTDPPYGINIVGGSKSFGKVGGSKSFGKVGGSNIVSSNTYSKVIGDETTQTAQDFYNTCVSLNFKNIVLWGGNYFTDFLKPSRCWFIWDKEMTGNFSEAEMAWTSFSKGGIKVFRHLWNGLSRSGNRKDELINRVHPTQKPVGLFERIFNQLSDSNIIFDGFLGSGSTLIACEKTNRICYGMEIDPKYCDVIVKRWEDYTGQKSKLLIEAGA